MEWDASSLCQKSLSSRPTREAPGRLALALRVDELGFSSLWVRMEEDKERRKHQRDGAEQFDDDMQRWAGGILEGITDGIADDAGLVREGFFGKDVALVILQE